MNPQTDQALSDQTLTTLCHDIRGALCPIIGWAELLKVSKLPPERVTEAVEVIQSQAKRIVEILDSLEPCSRVNPTAE